MVGWRFMEDFEIYLCEFWILEGFWLRMLRKLFIMVGLWLEFDYGYWLINLVACDLDFYLLNFVD